MRIETSLPIRSWNHGNAGPLTVISNMPLGVADAHSLLSSPRVTGRMTSFPLCAGSA